jgi:hypothetical protein
MSNGCLSMLLRRLGTEKQLADADGNRVSRSHDWAAYLEERSEMLQRWADLLDPVAVAAGLAPVSELCAAMAGQPSALQAA